LITPYLIQNQQKFSYSEPFIWVSYKAPFAWAKYGKELTKIICKKIATIDEAKGFAQP
jgi:hypothetical protein